MSQPLMQDSVQNALDFALFMRRQAHSRLRNQRRFYPEWNNQENWILDAARFDLRTAIRWVQIAKYRRDLVNA